MSCGGYPASLACACLLACALAVLAARGQPKADTGEIGQLVDERELAQVKAPTRAGARKYLVIEPAPGRYVRQKAA